MTFPPGKTSASLTVKIYDDLVAEGTKEFFLNLEIPPAAAAMGVHSASLDNATVRITDGDSECCSSALHSGEHNQDIVHLLNRLPEHTGCAILNPLDWSIN